REGIAGQGRGVRGARPADEALRGELGREREGEEAAGGVVDADHEGLRVGLDGCQVRVVPGGAEPPGREEGDALRVVDAGAVRHERGGGQRDVGRLDGDVEPVGDERPGQVVPEADADGRGAARDLERNEVAHLPSTLPMPKLLVWTRPDASSRKADSRGTARAEYATDAWTWCRATSHRFVWSWIESCSPTSSTVSSVPKVSGAAAYWLRSAGGRM